MTKESTMPDRKILLFASGHECDLLTTYNNLFKKQAEDEQIKAQIISVYNFNLFSMIIYSLFLLVYRNATVTNVIVLSKHGRIMLESYMGSLFWRWIRWFNNKTIVIVSSVYKYEDLQVYRRNIISGNRVGNFSVYFVDKNLMSEKVDYYGCYFCEIFSCTHKKMETKYYHVELFVGKNKASTPFFTHQTTKLLTIVQWRPWCNHIFPLVHLIFTRCHALKNG